MKDKKGFTLAETMIVLVILGVVAAITVPALVRNQIEAQNRTRIKKAMTVYDTAINKMVVENNLKSNDALYSSNPDDNRAFAPQGNCTRTSAYFKILRTLNDDNGTNCRFCSYDNVCWDISNILKPIIGIGEEGIRNENSTNRYKMFAHFGDNGELRVDDVAYEQSHNYLTDDEKEELVALYNFANNKKSSSGETAQKSPFDECKEKGQDTCTVNGITYTPKQFTAQCYDFPRWADAEHKGTQSCGTTGTFWVAELGRPADYDTQAKDYEGSTCQECQLLDGGDYYNAAKRYCESSGGHLPTVGELISGGYTDGGFWAAEEYSSESAYTSGDGAVNLSKSNNYDVVCVGN